MKWIKSEIKYFSFCCYCVNQVAETGDVGEGADVEDAGQDNIEMADGMEMGGDGMDGMGDMCDAGGAACGAF